MTLLNFFQLLVSGIAMGAIYTLTAKGLFITHLATHRLNFGQGDFLMVGAFASIGMLTAGVPAPLAVLGVLVLMGVLGYLLERFAIRPLDRLGDRAGAYSWVLTTAGAALILQNIVELGFGKSAQYAPPLFSKTRDNVISILGVGIFFEEAAIIITAFIVVGAFYWFLFGSRWGKAVYAVAFNPEAASLFGIDVRGVVVLVFVLAALMAGISGVLVGPLVSVHPHMGLIFTIKALAVAAVGGFTNPVGILLGGLLFGVAEAFSNYWDSAFGDLYPLLFVMALLAVRPSGLFGERRADVR
ncbi:MULTISPECIES: branched-chain amino acid ABC transporter permease [Xanthobacter]|uniref:Branched-chain amino acid ABC transporter permease n=1 Tax=Xanthobacter flavus TaxID=281 RepID=A0A9W6FIN1_XANFL|nr:MULTISPECIES: branched-chain amino acid ABC transporter permease [Xanthobacter]MDR6332454.1 branched-chain amino acid transport system permease protein [Xanthobacter flavus]NMN56670.1 branched-chain amino acid transport system permease protein [Xanthobacter sp. SG618]UJX45098.1 branched-chain amino acid ABC transporter permease [Xanthobacter sp. YC-JY1]GLI21794.1 branched-chain amino acid ABC transporter permease [Xanthobacter flavus]